MLLFPSIWVYYKLLWTNILPNKAILRSLIFFPLQKPWFTIETLTNMAAPQFIELSSRIFPNTLFCLIAYYGELEPGRDHGVWTNVSSQVVPIHACSELLTRVIFSCPGLEQRERPGHIYCPLVWSKREGQGSGPGPWPTGFGQDLAGIMAGTWARILSLGTFSNIS